MPNTSLRAKSSDAPAAQQLARAPAARRAADARGRVGNPSVITHLLHIEVAHVIKVLGQPEEQKEPGRIAHEFREHQRLHAAQA